MEPGGEKGETLNLENATSQSGLTLHSIVFDAKSVLSPVPHWALGIEREFLPPALQ